VLRRNPYYPFPYRAGFDAIVYDFNVDERRALEMIRHGPADYAAFYGGHAGSTLAAQLGAAGDASGIRSRRSPRPGAHSGSSDRDRRVLRPPPRLPVAQPALRGGGAETTLSCRGLTLGGQLRPGFGR
jgi:hypothetical protein